MTPGGEAMISIRNAKTGEAALLTALCIRSKAYWGYEDTVMKRSAAELAISEPDIVDGGVLVAFDAAGRTIGVAGVVPEGETADLDVMFVDPPAIGSGAGRVLFEAAVGLARQFGARRMTILADPNAASFYERMCARLVRNAPSNAIPARLLPLYEYDLTAEGRS